MTIITIIKKQNWYRVDNFNCFISTLYNIKKVGKTS